MTEVRRPTDRFLRDERGLTLIELVVVVACLAIIAAIAVVLFQGLTQKSRLSADLGTVGAMRSAVAIYYAKTNGGLPANLDSVRSMVVPAPAFQCAGTLSYDSTNGKVSYAASLADCP